MADATRFVEGIGIVGGAASVIGLAITVWVLVVAKGARKAAEDARTLALEEILSKN